MKNMFICMLACLLVVGCVTPYKSDKITEITTSGVGAHMTVPGSAAGELFKVDVGIFRQRVKLTPTSTNGPVYAPRTMTAFKGGNSVNPISTEMIENDMTGDVMISTNQTGGAVIPKFPFIEK